MRKPSSAAQLAVDILARSRCLVQVGAAVVDTSGRIIAWGWNSIGAGFGLHAEAHAIQRANRKRLIGATIYVAGQWHKNARSVPAKPCPECQRLIDKYALRVVWRDAASEWQER